MTGINDIKAMALAYGACNKVASLDSIGNALSLLMTPQGREFALKTGFPTYQVWREFQDSLKEDDPCEINGIIFLVDSVKTIVYTDCIAVGSSKMIVRTVSPRKLIHVIAMHGAEVEIEASNYAVVSVTSINSTVTVKNDGTAIVSVEQSEKGGSQ